MKVRFVYWTRYCETCYIDEMDRREFVEWYNDKYARMFESLQKFEDAERDYVTIKKAYTDKADTSGYAVPDLEQRAASDWRLKKAAGDCSYFRQKASMYAGVLNAVNGRKNFGPQTS